VAAHLEPEILLVDEVLAVGDAEFKKKCLGKMGEVAGEGRTVLFVSHNMGAIQRLCRTVFLLDRGCIIKSGVSQEVTQEYLQMNTAPSLIWARTDSDDSDAYLERIYLCNDKGEIITVVTTGIALQIVMEFTLRRIPYNLQVSVGLVNENGEQVFGSSPQDSGAYPPNKPGKYRSVVYFPEGLLMPRTYMVRAVLWTPELGALDSKDKIKFTAIETASLGNSTPGGRLGMIALRCKWEFQTLKQ
jgi:lipopolysaccharide transport system ATP-binding protein